MDGKELKRCKGGCQGLARYCCPSHQKAHWERHKFFCQRAGRIAEALSTLGPAALLSVANRGAQPEEAEDEDSDQTSGGDDEDSDGDPYPGSGYPPALNRAFDFMTNGQASRITPFSEEFYWYRLFEKKPFRYSPHPRGCGDGWELRGKGAHPRCSEDANP